MIDLVPTPYKIVAVIALVLASYFYGLREGSAKAELAINQFAIDKKELQTKIDQKQVEVVEKVVTQYVDKIVYVKDKGAANAEKFRYVPDTNVMLSSGWVYSHNSSATATDADTARVTDATPSGVTADSALQTINTNYTICHENAEQVRSLQKWILETKVNIEGAHNGG